MKNLIALVSLLAVIGCKSELRTKGGTSAHVAQNGAAVHLAQPENPKDTSTQDFNIDDGYALVIPAGSTLRQQSVDEEAGIPRTNIMEFKFSQPASLTKSHHEGSVSKIGAAQKDTLGETIAKLKSAKIFVFIGIFIMLVGIAFAVYPPLATLAGGFVPGAVCAGAGLVVAVLPYFIIGNEKLFAFGLLATGVIAGGVIYVHKHGGVTAELATLKSVLNPTPGKPSPAGAAIAPPPFTIVQK